MFAIRVLPTSQSKNEPRLAEIKIGDFVERFVCGYPSQVVDQLESRWKAELRRLVAGATAVALIHDPRFAWIIWREGNRCYIQQKLSSDGSFQTVGERYTITEEGDKVSEWVIEFAEIVRFLEA